MKAGGRTIADTAQALKREADYPPVYHVPREDADMSAPTRVGHATHCPHKGDAS
ncbi:DUF427 domain-containing protein [Sphingomonas sp. DT-204]|uniref:DUF427 domain-containing protein n=1 Tax=Sphingomonas sp. DT-204 TaxID=3396166 RepID=UPI003F197618